MENEEMSTKTDKKPGKVKKFFSKHFWDFLLLGALLFGTASIYLGRAIINNKDGQGDLIATVFYEGNVMEIMDGDENNLNPFNLSKINDYEEIKIQGKHTSLTIGLKHNSIAVVNSGCPGQECVHEKWVSKANHPIVCAHNGIYIEIESDKWSDVVIG